VFTGIVLAAGTSSRLGATKQLLEFDGKPLVQHAVDAASGAGLDEIIVVLGHDAALVEAALRLPSNGRVVLNPRYERGLSTSLAVGLQATDPASEAAVVLLADQPGVTAAHVLALTEGFRARRPRIGRLRFRNGPGPALLSREIWPEVMRLEGDTGARELMAEHPQWVDDIAIDEDTPVDLDTPENVRSARALGGPGAPSTARSGGASRRR
jgi:molybdenum cofactor cytidylyltransferase